jgi:hypothetical protein
MRVNYAENVSKQCINSSLKTGQGRAGQGRAGQGRAGQGINVKNELKILSENLSESCYE